MKNTLVALTVVVLVLVAGVHADGQSVKPGTVASHFGWTGTGKLFDIEEGHQFFTGEFNGTVFNDAGSGFLHLASHVCPGASDIVNGVFNANGYCVITDSDGAKAFLAWKCGGPLPRCTGDWRFLGGTGKYTGLSGSGTFFGAFSGTSFQQGYAVTQGEFALPE